MTAASTRDVRRRAERCSVRIPVTWRVEFERERSGELVDVSSDGLFVALPDEQLPPPQANALVTVVAFVAGEGHALEGRVRWVGRHVLTGQHGMGVGFDANSAYQAEALAFAITDAARTSGVFARER